MYKFLIVLLACLCVARAGLAGARLEPKPDRFKHQPGCYVKSLDEVIPFGRSRPSKTSCMEIRCGEKMMTYVTCSVGLVDPPCQLVSDLTKPYPRCCPDIMCP